MADDTKDPSAPGPDLAAPPDSAEKAEKAGPDDLGKIAKDENIVHAPQGIAGGSASVRTGRYLEEPKPDAAEVSKDSLKPGEVTERDVWEEILDNSATPRYRQIARAGLAYYPV